MFIQTDSGRLQNLYTLQNVKVINTLDDNKYTIAFIQINGEVILDGTYETEEKANEAYNKIVTKLLS